MTSHLYICFEFEFISIVVLVCVFYLDERFRWEYFWCIFLVF